MGLEPDPIRGLFEARVGDNFAVVEYEPDTDLRDTEQIPLPTKEASKDSSTARCYPTCRTAAPGTTPTNVKIGYEISFTRHFYKPQPMRPLDRRYLD